MDDNKEEEKIDVQEETEKYIIRNMESSLERPKYSAKRDRAKYDDLTKRKQFRDAQFGDKQTIKDPYTGETLHKSTKAAQNKYGKNRANYHTAQTDHTIPIETLYDKTRNNVFIDDNGIKKIVNIEKNYKEINGHLNQSKGSKSNIKTILKNKDLSTSTKKNMIQEQVKAEIAVDKEITKETLKGANKVGFESAMQGIKIGTIISTAQNATALAKGEEDFEEFVYNIGTDVARTGVTTYSMAIINKSIEGATRAAADKIKDKTEKTILKKAGEKVGGGLLKVANGNAIGEIVNITMEVGKSMKLYLDGDLDEAELIDNLSEKGSGMATALATTVAFEEIVQLSGMAAGIAGVVVSTVGYMVGTAIYNQVKNKAIKIAELDENIEKYNNLAEQIKNYRQELERNLEQLQNKNTQKLMKSFKQIEQSILNNDVATFTNSLNDICNVFGKEVKFKTDQEFVDFWNDPDMVLEI